MCSAFSVASAMLASAYSQAFLTYPERTLPLFNSNHAEVEHASRGLDMSGDGRFVVMLKQDGTLVLSDMELKTTKEIHSSASSDDSIISADISRNGRYISIITNPVDTINSPNVYAYIYDNVTESLIPVVSVTNQNSHPTPNNCSTEGGIHSRTFSDVSNTGVMTFSSPCSNLVNNDNNSSGDIFSYSIATDSISLVSHKYYDINESATNSGVGDNSSESFQPRISSDGSHILYTSKALDLTENNCADEYRGYHVYLYDTVAKSTIRLSECSEVKSSWANVKMALSSDGSTAFYVANEVEDGSSETVFYDIKNGKKTSIGLPITYDLNSNHRFKYDLSYDGRFLLYHGSVAFDNFGAQKSSSNTESSNGYINLFDQYSYLNRTLTTHYKFNSPVRGSAHNELSLSASADFWAGATASKRSLTSFDTFREIALHNYHGNGLKRNFKWINARNDQSLWSVFSGMYLIADNTWEAYIEFEDNGAFKFDIGGTWDDDFDFGDNDQDGIAKEGEGNIYVTDGAGRYRIIFNDETLDYSATKVADKKHNQVYLRGTFNNWQNNWLMDYKGNQIWEKVVTFGSGNGQAPSFKFDIHGDWNTESYGASEHVNELALFGNNIEVEPFGTYLIRFYENSNQYIIVKLPRRKFIEGNVDSLDGDNYSDILWRNYRTGLNYVYMMIGDTVKKMSSLGKEIDPKWKAYKGDIDGNGNVDIIYHHEENKEVWAHYHEGARVREVFKINSNVDYNKWQIVGIADIDGDSKEDILWRDVDALDKFAVYLMDGKQIKKISTFNGSSTRWKIKGLVDLNQDYRSDIVWVDAVTGSVKIDFIDGLDNDGDLNVIEEVDLSDNHFSFISFSDYELLGVGEFDEFHGVSSLLFRERSTNDVYVSYVKPYERRVELRDINLNLGSEWKVYQVSDFNRDKIDDILVRSVTTGEVKLAILNDSLEIESFNTVNTIPSQDWQIIP